MHQQLTYPCIHIHTIQRQEAARNALYTRAFRDITHRGESVQELITDFERLALQADLTSGEYLQMFAW